MSGGLAWASEARSIESSRLVSESGAMEGEAGIREIVGRGTQAWNTQDVDLLLSVFHPLLDCASVLSRHAGSPARFVGLSAVRQPKAPFPGLSQ